LPSCVYDDTIEALLRGWGEQAAKLRFARSNPALTGCDERH
jgi:hypothetical protein